MNRRDIFKWITGAVIAPVAPERIVAAVTPAVVPVAVPVVAAKKALTKLDMCFIADAERISGQMENFLKERQKFLSLVRKSG
jgi:hypothetical protein